MFNRTSKKITSLQNPLVKHLVKLNADRSYREKEKRSLVMGEVVIRELIKHFKPLTLCSIRPTDLSAEQNFETTIEILKKITHLPSPPEMVAEFVIPEPQDLSQKKRLIACDKVADPGNLGTLLRSALAFGWEGVILLNQSVDLFNDKVIRASRGGSFLLPYFRGEVNDLSTYPHEIFVADLEGENPEHLNPPEELILLLGNEGQGPTEAAIKRGKRVTIPMENQTESLNVAVAGSLLMYLLRAS